MKSVSFDVRKHIDNIAGCGSANAMRLLAPVVCAIDSLLACEAFPPKNAHQARAVQVAVFLMIASLVAVALGYIIDFVGYILYVFFILLLRPFALLVGVGLRIHRL